MTSTDTVRRGLFGVFAGGLLTFGAVAIIAPVARAEPGPAPTSDCSAASVAGTVSTASAAEGAFLTANPQTNEALSQLSTQGQPAAEQAYVTYLKDNPQVQRQLEAIYEPVGSLRELCGITVTPTPVAHAVFSVQTPQPPAAPEPPGQTRTVAPMA
ncbi:hemophore-related protein [Mycolicibacterium sp. 3033]|nr:hemophore-related protein [Mycolicibacterium aurantiacum]